MSLGNRILKLALCAGLLPAAGLRAQDQFAPTMFGKWQVGILLEGTPLHLFRTGTVDVATANPTADFQYTGSFGSRRVCVAPTVEYRFRKRFTLGVDFRFEPVQYTQQIEIWSGSPDPNSPYDDRQPSDFLDATKADYLEMPVVARYFPLSGKGWRSRIFVAAGADYRRVLRVRTTNEFYLASGMTYSDNTPDTPNHLGQIGWVVGVGYRYVDDFNIKSMPEIRYVRWTGPAFQGVALRSAVSQIEIGVGFSY